MQGPTPSTPTTFQFADAPPLRSLIAVPTLDSLIEDGPVTFRHLLYKLAPALFMLAASPERAAAQRPGTWVDQAAGIAILVVTHKVLPHFEHHPLFPWDQIGSQATINVVNDAHVAVPVFARASEVDSATRYIGTVPACDSAVLRLPYVDTRVTVLLGNRSVVLPIREPGQFRLYVSAP